jgi:hypothetical protein
MKLLATLPEKQVLLIDKIMYVTSRIGHAHVLVRYVAHIRF